MEKGALRMSLREHLRNRVCRRLLEGSMSEGEAAGRLGLSPRQVRRLKKRVGAEGARGVVHRLRGRPSNRRTGASVEAEVRRLYQQRYAGWNMSHFSEWLRAEHGMVLSREKVRQILLSEPERPRRHRRRRHRRWRERRRREGELVQMDTSIHPWLGEDGERSVLISAIDDATSKVLWSEFFACDGTLENLAAVKGMVREHGVCASLYLDRAGRFFLDAEAHLAALERGEPGLTQFGRVMRELGIAMIKARSPQAKGRIERLFNTFQDRLVKELELKGIRRRTEANRYLHEEYLPRHNQRFSAKAADPEPAYVRIVEDLDYNAVFCLKATRVIQNDYTISLNGRRVQLEGRRLRSKEKVEVRTWVDGSEHVYYRGEEVSARTVLREVS